MAVSDEGIDRLLAWSDADWAALQDHMGSVNGWEVGRVLSDSDIAGLRLEWKYHEDTDDEACDAYERGLKHGRTEAGGTGLARALEKIDQLKAELAAEKTLNRIFGGARSQ